MAFDTPIGPEQSATEEPTLEPRDALTAVDRRSLIVFVAATVLLVVFEYWGLPARFEGSSLHGSVADALGPGYRPYFSLLPYQFWGVSSLVIRVLAPVVIIVLVLRENPRDWGFRIRGQWDQLRPYAIALLVMVPVVYVVSALASFQAKYPFYELASAGGWHFWGYHLFYGLQFLGLEVFFRGFLLFGLYRRLGYYAIPVMVIPYTMIHFGKPVPETFAAIIAGFVLGYLALKSRSVLWGWAVHWGVAITMDLMVIGREIGFTELGRVLF
jgi:membrane protease YdiL (CAAX protease family)